MRLYEYKEFSSFEEIQEAFNNFWNFRAEQPPDEMDGRIYIIEAAGYYKIGKSKDPKKRLLSLSSTIMPYEFILEFSFPCRDSAAVERNMHRLLLPWRHRGEWFDLGQNELEYAKLLILQFADITERIEVVTPSS